MRCSRLSRAPGQGTAQNLTRSFLPGPDNLREWLSQVEKRLGSITRRLGDSVAVSVINTDLAGDAAAEANTTLMDNVAVKRPGFRLTTFSSKPGARPGRCYTFCAPAEFDFAQVLDDKNAKVSVRQIIRELEASLDPLRSPMVLNGGGFGLFANHSLVMAN